MAWRRFRRAAPVAAAVALALALAPASAHAGKGGGKPGPAAEDDDTPPQKRPNVIVVMTDDMRVDQLTRETMPKTFRLLGKEGTRFTNSFVSSPLCCPSRAGLLSGRYPHNDGVFDNTPGYGALRNKDQTIFTWLRNAGYRTGHFGRFLLNYDTFSTRTDDPYAAPPPAPPAPPGVDDWFGFAQGQTAYYGAPFSDNGTLVHAPTTTDGYTTSVITSQAREFIRASAPGQRPFFLWVAHLAPHTSILDHRGKCGAGAAQHQPGTYHRWRREPLPKPPSFGEKAIRDKPAWIRSRPKTAPRHVEALTRGWRCALASLATVDNGVAALIRELRAQKELDSTAIFFTSDNGLLYGEHRVILEKLYPYEENIRVPLLARVPPAYLKRKKRKPAARFVNQSVTNLDLAATVLDLADARPCAPDAGPMPGVRSDEPGCPPIDGRSLLPLLSGRGRAWPADRAVLIELGNRNCGTVPIPGTGIRNYYNAIRTRRYIYVELNRRNPANGACDRPEYELYDLKEDPYQLKNIAVNPERKPPSEIQASLANRLHGLAACAGIAGRDPAVAGRPHCE